MDSQPKETSGLAQLLDERLGTAAEPVWLWDITRRRIVWANESALVFWGAGSLFDLIEFAFSAESAMAKLAACADSGTAETVLSPDGKAIAVRVRLDSTPLPGGGKGLFVTVIDRHEPKTDAGSARKIALFEAAPIALLLADPKGHVLQANDPARHCMNALPHDVLEALVRQALVDGMANRIAVAGPAGRERKLRLQAARLADPHERAPAALVRIEDITERLELEALLRAKLAKDMAALQQLRAETNDAAKQSLASLEAECARLRHERDAAEARSRAKSDFIAKLTHEMRNPLNAIIGFSEIMQQARFGPLGDKRYEGYIDDIRMSAGHLMSLVNDLLDLSAIEAGKFRIHFDSVSLAGVIDDCIRLLKTQASDLGIELKSAVPANLPPVVADARALRQVMLNLISNAVKFTPAGGEVFVSASLTGDGGVSVAVRDTGVGMTRSEIELALEPFGQVDGPLQRERKGTGLGLPLAKALTEANRAQFNLSSEPSRGTVAEVVFPPARVLAG